MLLKYLSEQLSLQRLKCTFKVLGGGSDCSAPGVWVQQVHDILQSVGM